MTSHTRTVRFQPGSSPAQGPAVPVHEVQAHDASGPVAPEDWKDLSLEEMAARRRKRPDSIPVYAMRAALILPIARYRPRDDHPTVAEITPIWSRVAKSGPFEWIYQIEKALVAEIGICSTRVLKENQSAALSVWLSPRVVARGIANGWIPASPEMPRSHGALETRLHPMSAQWMRRIWDENPVTNRAFLPSALFRAAVADGYPVPIERIREMISVRTKSGEIRFDDSGMGHLLPSQRPNASWHMRHALIAQLGPLDGIDLRNGELMRVIAMLEARLAPRSDLSEIDLFRRIVLGLSLAIAHGLVPADPRNLFQSSDYWSD